MQTYRAVMGKFNVYLPLGYSCAGEVIKVGDDVTKFKVYGKGKPFKIRFI